MKGHANLEKQSTFRDVLTIGSFRYLWAGQIFSQLAANTLLFVLALRVYQTTGSNTAVSGLFLAYGIPALLFGMVGGTVVDHLDKRRVLITCDVVRAISAIVFVFLSHHPFVVYILTFFNAIITQLYVPAEAPMIPKLVSPRLLVTANSLFSFTFYSSLAVGSLFAGPMLRWFGPNGVFFCIGMFFLIASWSASRLPDLEEETESLKDIFARSIVRILRRVVSDLHEGVLYITHSKVLMDAIFLLTGTQVILAILGTLGPGFADRVLGIDVRDSSLVIVGPVVIGIILGSLWIGHRGHTTSPARLIRRGITIAGVILMLISLTVWFKRVPGLSWIFAESIIIPLEFLLFFLLGIANSLLDVPANSILQKEAEGAMRGRVYGMLTAAVGGAGILPVVVGGVLADFIGAGKVIFALGVGLSAYGLYRIRYNK